jgi:hypothetical protein
MISNVDRPVIQTPGSSMGGPINGALANIFTSCMAAQEGNPVWRYPDADERPRYDVTGVQVSSIAEPRHGRLNMKNYRPA